MRRWVLALVLLGLLAVAFVLAEPVWSFSDGVAGSSGQIDESARDCGGQPPCIVTPGYCGGCHGTYQEMRTQEDAKPTPQERVGKLTFSLNGDSKAGTARGKWEYNPGQVFTIDIHLADERPVGTYNAGGFDLNASAGQLSKWTAGDENVRITGGLFRHAGTKNPNVPLVGDHKYGASEEDESAHAGEATHTAKGAEARQWKVKWTAPATTPPRGVALVMTAMLPDGNDGLESCTSACNQPQDLWDWYGFMIPRRILCEQGAYASFKECSEAVYDYILPPAPAVASCGAENLPQCETTTPGGNGGGAPGPSALSVLAFAAVAAWAHRRQPKRY